MRMRSALSLVWLSVSVGSADTVSERNLLGFISSSRSSGVVIKRSENTGGSVKHMEYISGKSSGVL
jgi:hypothetical protein